MSSAVTEARLTQVLNGIARSMAPTSLKKVLSFEAVRLAFRERVQQRLPPGRRAVNGGSIGGSAEDGVSSDTTSAGDTTVAKDVGEVRPPGIAERSASTVSVIAESSGEAGLSWPRAMSTASAIDTAVTKAPEQTATVPPLQQPSSLLVELGPQGDHEV